MPQLVLTAKQHLFVWWSVFLVALMNIAVTIGNQWLLAFEDVEPGDLTSHKYKVKWVSISVQVCLTMIALFTKMEKKVVDGEIPFDDQNTTIIQRTQIDSIKTNENKNP